MSARLPFALPGATVQHGHGTRSRYVVGCRCSECRAANTAAYHEREARARVAAASIAPSTDGLCPGIDGQSCPRSTRLRSDSTTVCARCRQRLVWNGLVDAKPARKHLRSLSRRGVGYKTVADASDTAKTTLQKIMSGEKKRIRKRTSDAILEVDLEAVADHGLVPAGPTWEMLRRLQTEWLTAGALAQELGCQKPALQIGRTRVLARTEMKVRRLYERVFGDDREAGRG